MLKTEIIIENGLIYQKKRNVLSVTKITLMDL